MTSIRDDVLRLGEFSVRVRVTGEGPPLLLLNGVGAPLELWRPLLRRLDGVRAIAVDLPGSGDSEAPRLPLTVGGYARLAVELLDALDCARASVLGFSFGGMVAQELARLAGPRLDRLVLASTSCGWGGVPGDPTALLSLSTPDRYYSRVLYDAVVDGVPVEVAPATASPPDFAAAAATERGVRGPAGGGPWTRLPAPAEVRRGRLFQFWAAATWSSAWWLHEVRVPTLVVTGDRDRVVPPVNARLLATLLPHARLHVVRDGGHLCLMERAAQVAPVVRDFLVEPAGWDPVARVAGSPAG